MFMGHTGNEYPDRRVLQLVLEGAAARIDSGGNITLTSEDADLLRAAGWVTVLGPGNWHIPRLPLDAIRRTPALRALAVFWYGERALAPPPPPSPPAARPTFLSPEKSLRFTLAMALRDDAPRALLLSLARRRTPTPRRRLQQIHGSRLPAARFNPTLDTLIRSGFIDDTDGMLTVNPLALTPLHELLVNVKKTLLARAQRRATEGARERANKRGERHEGPAAPLSSGRKRRYKRRPIPNRWLDPRGWALAMLGRRGGLARQRQARLRGEVSTARANLAKRRTARRRATELFHQRT
jgi:hypothetical protein